MALSDIFFVLFHQQTAEPGLYQEDNASSDDVYYDTLYDVKGADMNNVLDDLDAFELDKLFQYFRQRGPRAYDDDEFY